MTNKFDKYLAKQRTAQAPLRVRLDVEREVMRHVLTPPKGAGYRFWWAALAGSLAVVTGLLVSIRYPEQTPKAKTDFCQTVIMLENHTAIWLEPADKGAK